MIPFEGISEAVWIEKALKNPLMINGEIGFRVLVTW